MRLPKIHGRQRKALPPFWYDLHCGHARHCKECHWRHNVSVSRNQRKLSSRRLLFLLNHTERQILSLLFFSYQVYIFLVFKKKIFLSVHSSFVFLDFLFSQVSLISFNLILFIHYMFSFTFFFSSSVSFLSLFFFIVLTLFYFYFLFDFIICLIFRLQLSLYSESPEFAGFRDQKRPLIESANTCNLLKIVYKYLF